MNSSKKSDDLAEVQEAISSRAGNVAFLKKINLEKGGTKYLAISTNRIFLLSTKAPYKIDASFHFLEIQSVESTKPQAALLKTVNEKTYVINTEDDDDVLFIVAQTLAFLRYNFPGSKRYKCVELNVKPSERLQNITSLAAALANPTTDSESGPCGGFSLSYSSVCDLHGVMPMAEVIWDVDKIYGSHGCTDFSISDFDHLEAKELTPLLGTLEFNNWFKSFSCRSYKLSSELVEVLAKVLRSNCSIQELDLYECRLTKESLQKIAQAIASNPETDLRRLNLGQNAIDEKGVSSLSNFLSNLSHGLESLLIKDVNITGKGISSICSALKSNIYTSSSLTCLNISSNPLKAEGLSAVCELLANANVIQELNLSKTECSLDMVFGALARGCLQHLKVLNLSGNSQSHRKGKDSQVGPSVNKFFSSSMALQSINLSNTKINPEFLKAVLIGLISNTNIKDVSLFLAGNELRAAGAAEISSCISGLGNVIHLDLRDNGLDMDIVNLCHNMQKNKCLQSLDLSQNIGKSKNVTISVILESIVEMILVDSLPLRKLSVADNRLKQDAGIIIDSLGTNDKLEEIDISGNLIGDEGARLLAKALQINAKLRKVSLDRNGITLKGFQSLATSMQRNYSLQLIPVPFGDIYPLIKSSGEAISKCFEKIDKLLLRNQSMDIVEADHSMKLKQNLLLSSLDHESTDRLLVQVQDAIDELKDADGDETVAKEVESGKESIKDADKMKQVLYKFFVDVDDPSEKIEEKADKLLKEMTDFADELVGMNVHGTLNHLKEQCPTIAANGEAIEMLNSFISTKGKVDSLGLKEMIARTMVKLISNKVSDATLNVAFSVGDYLTKVMQEALTRSKVSLSLLSREHKEKKRDEGSLKKGGSLPSTSGDEQDESVLAAQKAKNRISTQFLSEDGKGTVKGKAVTRRPTFRREQDLHDVAVEISIDEDSVTDEVHAGKPEQSKDLSEAIPTDNGLNLADIPADTEKEEVKILVSEAEVESSAETVNEMDTVKESGEKKENFINPEELEEENKSDKPESAQIPEVSGIDVSDKSNDDGIKTDVAPLKESAEKPKLNLDDVKRAASVSTKHSPKLDITTDKKPRPLSDLSFLNLDPASTNELVHLNKGRAKPQGRRPPTKASGLAHLQESKTFEETAEVAKETSKPAKQEIDSLKVSPKPRPKSMQPMESPGPEKEMGVIRTGSIPHKSSESLKARLQAEKEKSDVRLSSKPDLKKSPKPDIPKKEDSIKKPKAAVGKPIPGLPNKPSFQSKKDSSPSPRKDVAAAGKTEKPTDENTSDEISKETNTATDNIEKKENDKEKEKPKPKVYKPPGAVPMMGGPMGLGGALMAEMKKKRSVKNNEAEPKPAKAPLSTRRSSIEDKPTASSPPSVAARPVPAARKPPPPAKLSAEKRKSLILDSGSKPIITDKTDGTIAIGTKNVGSIAEHASVERKTEQEVTTKENDPSNDGSDATVDKDTSSNEQNNNETRENTA